MRHLAAQECTDNVKTTDKRKHKSSNAEPVPGRSINAHDRRNKVAEVGIV